ncbi:heat shock 70 kDa protein 12A-like [Dreissena polymorpha]|uniref:heat shock 70 kDa protein 12A-like n=1 Tax=Dreissena polymorpha TaxID=45954 RepID=UPI002264425B|nr:heat shock 70 kDa protein 12A-like [Dreissena polymorpha]
MMHMMDSLLEVCQKQVTVLSEKDIDWVLTVPAIWNDSAKHFMRLAAQEAGIEKEKLTIALEPEAASICCRHTKLHNDGLGGISTFQSGKKYLVVDAGGGTIDMTVHEVCFGGALKELHKATGGAWGGTMVDTAFLDFIAELMGKDAFNTFKDQQREDYIDLLRDFERKKRETDLKSNGCVTIRIARSMFDLVNDIEGQQLKNVILNSRHAKTIKLDSDKLRLDNGLVRQFFKESVDKIVHHISELLETCKAEGVDTILMVGGYSESTLLQDVIQKEFKKLKIIVPSDSGLAVLKGAVMFGHRPTFTIERVSKFTYSIAVMRPFDEKIHPVDKRIECDAGIICKDLFSVLVHAGLRLVVGEIQCSKEITPHDINQSRRVASLGSMGKRKCFRRTIIRFAEKTSMTNVELGFNALAFPQGTICYTNMVKKNSLVGFNDSQ